jgi:hypothetical protein
MFIAYATALLGSVSVWAYTRYVLKDKHAEKTFAKSLVANLLAATIIVVVIQNSQPAPSLQSEPFFAPLM